MINKDNAKTISMLVCFEGKNRRIEINPKKCVTNPKKDFSYKNSPINYIEIVS